MPQPVSLPTYRLPFGCCKEARVVAWGPFSFLRHEYVMAFGIRRINLLLALSNEHYISQMGTFRALPRLGKWEATPLTGLFLLKTTYMPS